MASPKPEYLHLTPLQLKDLPSHAALAEKQASIELVPLTEFAAAVLDQGLKLADTFSDGKTFVPKTTKSSPPATAKVEIFTGKHVTFAHPNEHWISRRSVHEAKNEPGTAEFVQFEVGLKDDHSKNESEYTPNVFDANELLAWDEIRGQAVGQFKDIEMNVYEMYHKSPSIVDDRVFTVLVITASYATGRFIVVQVPVNTSEFPAAFLQEKSKYENGKHRDTKRAVVRGRYVSVERVQGSQGEDGSPATGVVWEAGTASDAGGCIPISVTALALPGALAKDVGLFIKWVNDQTWSGRERVFEVAPSNSNTSGANGK